MEKLALQLPSRSVADPSAQGLTRDAKTDGWLSVAIEEYKSVRTESLDSMKLQNAILSYGVTAIGLIFTAGIGLIDKNMLLVAEVMFLLFIPLIVFFIVVIWAGEVARMYRAGSFLAEHEVIINQYVYRRSIHDNWDKPALVWETWLLGKMDNNKTPHHRLYIQHYSVLAMFLFLAILSVVIGNYKLCGSCDLVYVIVIDIAEACVLAYLAYLALFLLSHFHPPIARWLHRRAVSVDWLCHGNN